MSACCQSTTSGGESEELVLNREAKTWLRLGMAGLLAAQAMIFSLAVNMSPVQGNARWMIHGALALSALGVFLLAGLPILRESWAALRRGRGFHAHRAREAVRGGGAATRRFVEQPAE